MKHLKLYEDFNRYEFGTQDPLTYNQMRTIVQHFPAPMYQEICELLQANNIRYDIGNINENNENYDIFMIDFNYVMVEIYYLGDYCYGIYSYNASGDESGIKLEVVEDIDDLVRVINRMKQELDQDPLNENLENFNKYEFGEYKLKELLNL